jgi:hypothetical protein
VGFLSDFNGSQDTAVALAIKQQTGWLRGQSVQTRSIHFNIFCHEKRDIYAIEFRKNGSMNGGHPKTVATSVGLTRGYPQSAHRHYMAHCPGVEPTCSHNSELAIRGRQWHHMANHISSGKMTSVNVERQKQWPTSLLTVQV